MIGRAMRLWRSRRPDTLFARIAAMLLLNLLLVQAVTFVLYRLEIDHLPAVLRDLPERVATTVRAIDALPPAERERVAEALSAPEIKVSIGQSLPPAGARQQSFIDPGAARLRARVMERLEAAGQTRRAVLVLPEEPAQDAGSLDQDEPSRIAIAIALKDGGSAEFRLLRPPPAIRWLRVLTSIASICIVISVLSLWYARRFSARLAQFASAADELGRSVDAPPLPESGARELRMATRAFNRMRERLRRFVHDRTQMLAAMSHDLRTPLTRLRLRAEFVEDDEQREKMLHDIQEMEAMITATLAFARDDVTREPRRKEDLDLMLQRICAAMREAGEDASYASLGPVRLSCSPVALRRALGNILDNAVKYGRRARARLSRLPGQVVVEVEDDGPGIPPDLQNAVFQPFFRLEASRNRDTGGVGLGLAVARTIVRGHGGDIGLANRPEGGLRVTVTLPA